MSPRLGSVLLLLAGCGGGEEVVGIGSSGSSNSGTESSGSCTPEPGRCDAFSDERPFRLSEHSSVYLEATRQLLVFGGSHAVPENCGFPEAAYLRETWLFDDSCGQWQELRIEGPSPRGRQLAAASDSAAWLFGGRFRETGTTTGNYQLYDDLWRFDAADRAWESVDVEGASPRARANGAMAWDSTRQELWLFGGNVSTNSFAPQEDLWSFDPETNRWQEHEISGGPGPRLYHSMFYDAERDQLVVYGGSGPGDAGLSSLPGLWALDLDGLSWQRLDAQGNAPEPRFWGVTFWDTEADRYMLFGGHDDTALGNRNDLWAFDIDARSWEAPASQDSLSSMAAGFCDFPPDFADVARALPERRNAHGLVWSETCGHAILFAGKTDCGVTDDVWRLSGAEWTELLPATEGEVCHRWRDDIDDCTNLCN